MLFRSPQPFSRIACFRNPSALAVALSLLAMLIVPSAAAASTPGTFDFTVENTGEQFVDSMGSPMPLEVSDTAAGCRTAGYMHGGNERVSPVYVPKDFTLDLTEGRSVRVQVDFCTAQMPDVMRPGTVLLGVGLAADAAAAFREGVETPEVDDSYRTTIMQVSDQFVFNISNAEGSGSYASDFQLESDRRYRLILLFSSGNGLEWALEGTLAELDANGQETTVVSEILSKPTSPHRTFPRLAESDKATVFLQIGTEAKVLGNTSGFGGITSLVVSEE